MSHEKIFIAGLAKSPEALNEALSHNNSRIDIKLDRRGFPLTPAGKLAAEGHRDAWKFLQNQGACIKYIAASLARVGRHEELHTLLNENSDENYDIGYDSDDFYSEDDSDQERFAYAALGLAFGAYHEELNIFLNKHPDRKNVQFAIAGFALRGDEVFYTFLDKHHHSVNFGAVATNLAKAGHHKKLITFLIKYPAPENFTDAAVGFFRGGCLENHETTSRTLALISDKLIRNQLANAIGTSNYSKWRASGLHDINKALKSANEIRDFMEHEDLDLDQACAWVNMKRKEQASLLQIDELKADDRTIISDLTALIFGFVHGLETKKVHLLKSKMREFIRQQHDTITEEKLSGMDNKETGSTSLQRCPSSLFAQPNSGDINYEDSDSTANLEQNQGTGPSI